MRNCLSYGRVNPKSWKRKVILSIKKMCINTGIRIRVCVCVCMCTISLLYVKCILISRMRKTHRDEVEGKDACDKTRNVIRHKFYLKRIDFE